MKRILLFTGAGAFAGLLAAMISTPFFKSKIGPSIEQIVQSGVIDARMLVTSGTTFGIASDILFGALVAAVIALLLAHREALDRRFVRAGIAAVIGAVLYLLVHQAIETAFLAVVKARYGSYTAPILRITFLQMAFEPLNTVLLPAAIALSVLAAHAFRRYYIGVALWATLLGGIAGMVARSLASVILVPIYVGKIMNSGGAQPLDLSMGGAVEFTVSMTASGAGIGMGFAFALAIHKAAWLKSIKGPTEGRTWSLQRPLSRIGCYEGNEVFLPPDGTVAPIHAQIQSQDEAHFAVDLIGDATLNGLPLQSAWLKDGDRIGVGASLLVYRTRLDSKNHPAQTPSIELSKAPPPGNPLQNATVSGAMVAPMQPSAPSAFKLVNSIGHEFILKEGVQIVGRDAGCEIALTLEPSVSRRHAEISLQKGTIIITDLGSTNGTFINGVRIVAPAPATPGSTIAFGQCEMRLQ